MIQSGSEGIQESKQDGQGDIRKLTGKENKIVMMCALRPCSCATTHGYKLNPAIKILRDHLS